MHWTARSAHTGLSCVHCACQGQQWQNMPGLLQTLQLTQLLSQTPQNQQGANLAALLGQQLGSAAGGPPQSQPYQAPPQVCLLCLIFTSAP